jgi:CRISPR/Cas system endoribonuclease Cas6 (RAMP superfamily)
LIFTFSSATKRLTELTKLAEKKFSIFYNDEMTNEWIWDKIRSKLTRAEEMKKYLKEIRNATHQTEQYAVKPRIQGR